MALLMTAARADAEVIVTSSPVGAVRLAGPDVVYDETGFKAEGADLVEYDTRIVRRRPGHAAQVIATAASSVETLSEGGADDLQWDTSATGLITGVGSSFFDAAETVVGARVRAGPYGTRPADVVKCSEDALGTPWVAASAALVAYTNTCDSESSPVEVRHIDRPHEKPLFSRAAAGSAIDLAGNYLAIGRGDDPRGAIAVYDWRDGTLLYTVTAPFAFDNYRPATFELQGDGKLAAVLSGPGESCEAAWFSPAAPEAHVLGRTDCSADVRLSSDKLAWMRAGAGHAELAVTALDGRSATVARFPARRYASTASPRFAWDGERLAYSVGRCDGRSTLRVRERVAGLAFHDRGPLACPLRVRRMLLGVKPRASSAAVPVGCPRGCAGTITNLSHGSSVDQPFALRRGRGYVRLFLNDGTRATLARHGHALIRLRIEASGRVGGARHDVRVRLYRR